MASAWGKAWGVSWGSSWGAGVTPPAPPPAPTPGAAAGGSRADRARPRIGRFPDLRAPEVIQEPARRRRRKREGDWLVFSSKH